VLPTDGPEIRSGEAESQLSVQNAKIPFARQNQMAKAAI